MGYKLKATNEQTRPTYKNVGLVFLIDIDKSMVLTREKGGGGSKA